jgi:hypothetical protein
VAIDPEVEAASIINQLLGESDAFVAGADAQHDLDEDHVEA